MPAAIRPDHSRLGGIDWLETTNGSLTGAEKRRLLASVARGQAHGLAGRVKLRAGRRPDEPASIPPPPDSALARAAEEACATQTPALVAHSYRTWAFGRALASVDGETRIDDELFYAAALMHDSGLAETVIGEDFALRSARIAGEYIHDILDAEDLRHLQDSISAHTTPGLSIEDDGIEAFYLQAGATLDLAGLRIGDLAEQTVKTVVGHHPRADIEGTISELIRNEAAAVPDGRFALLARTGFLQAIRMAPLRDR